MIRQNGERFLLRGEVTTTTIPEGAKLIGHVHPGESFMGLTPSIEDFQALGKLNQGRSAIFNESGAWRTFGSEGASSNVFMPRSALADAGADATANASGMAAKTEAGGVRGAAPSSTAERAMQSYERAAGIEQDGAAAMKSASENLGGELDGVGSATNAAAPKLSIGASGYTSHEAFSEATYQTYQQAVDAGYAQARIDIDKGILKVPAGINEDVVLGQQADRVGRETLRQWQAAEGVLEGGGGGNVVQINRRLYDPNWTGTYVVPDVFVPPARQIFDASTEYKTFSSTQVQRFSDFSDWSNITIVRPSGAPLKPISVGGNPAELMGSYSLLPPR